MNYNEIESFLTNLKSIMSCKIVVDNKDEIKEIHILSDSSRNSKQISRDIQSVLVSKFNLNIDYKKISIAQIDKNLSLNTEFRLVQRATSFESSDGKICIEIKLQWQNEEFTGQAEGVKSDSNIFRVAVRAALKAVENAVGIRNCFVLEDLKTSVLAEKDVILVAVSFVIDGQEQMFCGSAFVGTDRIETAVKAALDAINRRVAIYYNE